MSSTNQADSFGLLAEFDTVEALMDAATKVRDAGYENWDCHTPFPVHGLDQAMGVKSTILPWITLCGGLTGGMVGLLKVYWMNATSVDGIWPALRGYQYHISGKPIFSLPANIPPIFELIVLFSALATIGGLLVLNLLPRFYHPTLKSDRFRRVTDDKFFISIEAKDQKFDAVKTSRLLEEAGARGIETVEA